MADKELSLELFGSARVIGVFPTRLHTDVRTAVLGEVRRVRGKGRQVRLDGARRLAVEEAMRDTQFGSLEGLREQLAIWKDSRAWGAEAVDAYYDQERSEGYHQHNAVSQQALAQRAVESTGVQRGLVLDLGCGTGLSCSRVLSDGAPGSRFVVGLDLSSAMLATAQRHAGTTNVDFVRADMSCPLPFRDSVVDAVVSVGAVHYLLHSGDKPEPDQAHDGAQGATTKGGSGGGGGGGGGDGGDDDEVAVGACGRGARLHECFASVGRCLCAGSAVVFQFFPPSVPSDALVIEEAARRVGLTAALFCDFPHHTDAVRWNLYAQARACPSSTAPLPCALLPHPFPCALSLGHWARQHAGEHGCCPRIGDTHRDWLVRWHLKQARALLRRLKFEERAGGEDNGEARPKEQPHPRKRKRAEVQPAQQGTGHKGGGALDARQRELALALRDKVGAEVSLDALKTDFRWDELFAVLHPPWGAGHS